MFCRGTGLFIFSVAGAGLTILTVVILGISLALLLTGCGEHGRFGNDPSILYPTNHFVTPAVTAGRYGGNLTETLAGDPKTFNPWIADDIISGSLIQPMFDFLVMPDPFTLKFVPRLAYMPKISADGLTYTFTLRPGLKWSDGVPLTTSDVAFTVDLLYDPNIEDQFYDSMLIDEKQPNGKVKRVPFRYKIIDNRTIQFILPVKWAPALSSFGFPIAPKHVLGPIYRSGGFNTAWGTDTPPDQIVCSGPYTLKEYVPGERAVLVRNPYFWRYSRGQHLPYLDTFTDLLAPDINGQVLNFRAGDSDALDIPIPQYPVLAKYARRDNYTVVDEGANKRIEYLDFNRNATSAMDKRLLKVFSDVRFRQACSYAIDRQSLCDDILIGLAHPLGSTMTPANPEFYDPNCEPYPYDPAKAKKLLLDMGMTEGADGKLDYEGQPVSFEILTDVQDQSVRAITAVVTNDFQNIGLDAHEDPINRNTLITKIVAPPYDWQAFVLGLTLDQEPNDANEFWASSGSEHDWWPSEPKPETSWEARVDRDFTLGAQVLNPVKRKFYYDDYQQVFHDNAAIESLDYREQYCAVRNCFGNIQGDPINNLEEVYNIHGSATPR
jgi:peptide/nickel transport system substrate-binding protein